MYGRLVFKLVYSSYTFMQEHKYTNICPHAAYITNSFSNLFTPTAFALCCAAHLVRVTLRAGHTENCFPFCEN